MKHYLVRIVVMVALAAIILPSAVGCKTTSGGDGAASETVQQNSTDEDGLVFVGGEDLRLVTATSRKVNGVRHEHIVLVGREGTVELNMVGRKRWSSSFSLARVTFTPHVPTDAVAMLDAWQRNRGGYESTSSNTITLGGGHDQVYVPAIATLLSGWLSSLGGIEIGDNYATADAGAVATVNP